MVALNEIKEQLSQLQQRQEWLKVFNLLSTVTERNGGQEAELLQRQTLALIKHAQTLRQGGQRDQAVAVLSEALDAVIRFVPRADIFSELSVPTLFDAVAANLISHEADCGWLTRLNQQLGKTHLFALVEERSHRKDDDVRRVVDRDRSVLLAMPFGALALLYSLLFRMGWVAASYEVKGISAKALSNQSRSRATRLLLDDYPNSISWKRLRRVWFRWGAERHFSSLIRGARVALVGPGHNGLQQGDEIDGFDIVIRTNPIDIRALSANASLAGNRTDIGYYNGRMLKHRGEEALKAAADLKLKFACVRKRSAVSKFDTILGPRRSRVYRMDKNIFLGRGFALQHCIFDLMQYRPQKLKIFNADFFLAPQTHYSNYLDTKLNLVHSYAVHDVFRSWKDLKSLYGNNSIEADPVLSEILSLNESNFMERISARVQGIESTEIGASRPPDWDQRERS